MKKTSIGLFAVLAVYAGANANASFLNNHAADCAAEAHAVAVEDCAPRMVERTVLVPQWVTERRTINVTRCRPEERAADGHDSPPRARKRGR